MSNLPRKSRLTSWMAAMILACSRTFSACGSSSNDSPLLDDEPMPTLTLGQQIVSALMRKAMIQINASRWTQAILHLSYQYRNIGINCVGVIESDSQLNLRSRHRHCSNTSLCQAVLNTGISNRLNWRFYESDSITLIINSARNEMYD